MILHVTDKLLVLFDILPSLGLIYDMVWKKCVSLCMLPLQLIGLISSALCALYTGHSFLRVFTFIVVTLYLFMILLMLTGQVVLMIRSLRVGILCSLVLPLSHGNQWNNGRLLVHLTKLGLAQGFSWWYYWNLMDSFSAFWASSLVCFHDYTMVL